MGRQVGIGERGMRSLWLIGAALLALVIWLPTLRWLLNEWWTNDYYSHGLLVPPISAFLAWRLWPGIRREPSNVGALLLGASLAGYVAALASNAYYLAGFALIGMLAGAVWFMWGGQALRRLAFPIGFLIFMVPLPFIESQTLPLALFTGKTSGQLIRALGVDVAVNGSQVSLPNADLVVGAQCSGVRSIIALFTLVSLAIFLLEGPGWGKALMAVAAVPIAILGNVFRVASLLLVANWWGAEAGFTYYHDYSGIVFFLTAFAALLGLSWVVRCREIRSDLW
ncbi:MAG: exosortase [Anaerolineae bacterium]